jgi:hypothetical protein
LEIETQERITGEPGGGTEKEKPAKHQSIDTLL